MNKFLAAIGLGGNKAEADVSYDPALDENATGGEKGAGGLRPEVAASPAAEPRLDKYRVRKLSPR